jgi:uncharacterized protein YndB with AHSA1/START domain
MRDRFGKAALALALGALCATAGFAQAPGPAPGMRGPGPGGPGGPGAAPGASNVLMVANPTYTTLTLEITINRPAEEVWKRVGKYCDIGEWMRFPCSIISGKDGEVGAVRNIGREVLVGKTDLSYTYAQPIQGPTTPYNLYHGTMEAKPLTATTSKIVYTLMWDNSMLADDAAREQDRAVRRGMFEDALNNMKILAEGGTLPPRAGGPRGGPGAGGPGGPSRGGPGASAGTGGQ